MRRFQKLPMSRIKLLQLRRNGVSTGWKACRWKKTRCELRIPREFDRTYKKMLKNDKGGGAKKKKNDNVVSSGSGFGSVQLYGVTFSRDWHWKDILGAPVLFTLGIHRTTVSFVPALVSFRSSFAAISDVKRVALPTRLRPQANAIAN